MALIRASISHNRGVARAHSKQPGPESLQKPLIPMRGCCPHRKGSLYTRRTAPERQAVEGVPSGHPRPPDQPAQGPSAGSPLPQPCMVQGVTKPAPLANGISSSCREPQGGSNTAGTPSELGAHRHTGEQARQEHPGSGGSWGAGAAGLNKAALRPAVSRAEAKDQRPKGERACEHRTRRAAVIRWPP